MKPVLAEESIRMMDSLSTISTIVMMKALRMPGKKTSSVQFVIRGRARKYVMKCPMETMPLEVLASSPMHGSLTILTLTAHHHLPVANLSTSRYATLLLTLTMSVVATVMITTPIFAVILLLIVILTVAATGANVLQI